MNLRFTRTDIVQIFAGETLSPAARFLLSAMIERSFPQGDELSEFLESVTRIVKENGKLSAIKWIRTELGTKPSLVSHLRVYHSDPYSLVGAKFICEKIAEGVMPTPRAPMSTVILSDGEET